MSTDAALEPSSSTSASTSSSTSASPAESAANALHARYGAAWTAPLPDWNVTLETLLNHRSVRSYSTQPLPEGALETAIAAAQSTSTSSNLQTWSVVAVEDPERKARLSAIAANQSHVRNAPLFLVWLADLARLEATAARADVDPEGLHYLETLLVGVIDAALAAQSAVVALESLGLSSVYIGAIRNDVVKVAAELGLPPRVLPVFGLCVGYADDTQPTQVKPRLPQAAVLHREQYDVPGQVEQIGHYDEIMAAFQRGQGLEDAGWSSRSINRWRTRASLHGRDRLREALNTLGFELR